MIGNLKLSLHHIFHKIGYNFDILNEESVAKLNLDELREHWEQFCMVNKIGKFGENKENKNEVVNWENEDLIRKDKLKERKVEQIGRLKTKKLKLFL